MAVIKPHMTSRKPAEEKKEDERLKYLKGVKDSKILWVLLLALFMLYIVFKSVMLGPLIALTIFALIALEVWVGVKTGGLMKELKEDVLAIALGVVLWFGSGILLNTSTPLDAVVSCSMLPSLERGDMLVLQGGEVKAPTVSMSRSEWEQARAGGLMERQCAACIGQNSTYACLSDRGGIAMPSGLFDYACSLCERVDREGNREFVPCTTGVDIKGKGVDLSEKGEVIVYTPLPTDIFARSGDIVHRARFVVDVEGEKYIFTKGDNNNLFDVQVGNAPVEPRRIMGRAVLRVPWLGYFKLFISGLFEEPGGCESRFTGAEAIKIDR